MGKFDGILFCTDLDGTLYGSDKTISAENIKAIEYFKSEGGLFTFITGRMPYFSDEVYNAIKPNTYFGCINGGGLYDHIKGEYVWTNTIHNDSIKLAEYVAERVEGIGVQLYTLDNVYFCRDNDSNQFFRDVTGVPNLQCDFCEVPTPIVKILFASEDSDTILKIEQLLRSHPLADRFDFVASEKTLFEIMPKGVCKGWALEKLCEILNINPQKTVAIGDYDNDISMIKAAHAGIAVANATETAKAAADFITVSNDESAIAKVVYDIEKGKYI